jgi:hypothetical protein
MQSTSKILMVRPSGFGFNEQTSANNAFQSRGYEQDAQKRALEEFDGFVKLLEEAGVEVNVIEDTPEPHTPDSVFPNNWFSTHEGGTLVLYPMFAPNRRDERKPAPLDFLRNKCGYGRVIDLTGYETKEKFLEGTGSMVIDRDCDLVYACRSPRTNEEVLEKLAGELDFDYFLFDAKDEKGEPIYHTNVMMSVGSRFVLVCLDSLCDINERTNFIGLAEESDKEIIEISTAQVSEFAGNMLELSGKDGEKLLVMSARARKSLTDHQIERLSSYCHIISPDLETIEKNGGGSARCMIAELF